MVYYPEEFLRKVLPEVTAADEKLRSDVADLEKILKESDNGVGLAANQIGSEMRMFAMKGLGSKKISTYINPKIIGVYGQKVYPKLMIDDHKEEDFLEGCLSFPDLYGTVKRFLKIEAEWQELDGRGMVTKKGDLEGFEAIVYQHESDHLNGILFIDHIKRDGGKFYRWEGKEKIKWSIDKVVEEEK